MRRRQRHERGRSPIIVTSKSESGRGGGAGAIAHGNTRVVDSGIREGRSLVWRGERRHHARVMVVSGKLRDLGGRHRVVVVRQGRVSFRWTGGSAHGPLGPYVCLVYHSRGD